MKKVASQKRQVNVPLPIYNREVIIVLYKPLCVQWGALSALGPLDLGCHKCCYAVIDYTPTPGSNNSSLAGGALAEKNDYVLLTREKGDGSGNILRTTSQHIGFRD